jgi:RNA polymerase I-specific transcription initiation factor RRN6
MVLQPCTYQGDTASATPGLGRDYFTRNLRFFNLFMLLSDMSVHEAILCADSLAYSGARRDEAVADLSWSTAYRPRKDVRTIAGIREMDGFLQPEGIENVEQPESKLPSQEPILLESKATGLAHRITDHRFIFDALVKPDVESTGGTIDIQTIASQLKQSLNSPDDHREQLRGTL